MISQLVQSLVSITLFQRWNEGTGVISEPAQASLEAWRKLDVWPRTQVDASDGELVVDLSRQAGFSI